MLSEAIAHIRDRVAWLAAWALVLFVVLHAGVDALLPWSREGRRMAALHEVRDCPDCTVWLNDHDDLYDITFCRAHEGILPPVREWMLEAWVQAGRDPRAFEPAGAPRAWRRYGQ